MGLDLFENLEPMDASASTIEYSDETPIADADRANICHHPGCISHNDGDKSCPVPETWGDLRSEAPSNPYLVIPSNRQSSDDDVIVAETAQDIDFDEKQPVPDDTTCPYCGADVHDDNVVKHRLSAMGYIHDDIEMECDECGQTWPLGVPVGEFEGDEAEKLFCSSCESRFMRIHRVAPRWNSDPDNRKVMLHLKCPNCYYFEKQQRDVGPNGRSLVGYPDITGSTDGASPEGYRDE